MNHAPAAPAVRALRKQIPIRQLSTLMRDLLRVAFVADGGEEIPYVLIVASGTDRAILSNVDDATLRALAADAAKEAPPLAEENACDCPKCQRPS